jgi:hypothetical protein
MYTVPIIIFMLTTYNMATMRNSDIVTGKFNAAETSINNEEKWIIKRYT